MLTGIWWEFLDVINDQSTDKRVIHFRSRDMEECSQTMMHYKHKHTVGSKLLAPLTENEQNSQQYIYRQTRNTCDKYCANVPKEPSSRGGVSSGSGSHQGTGF